MHNKSISDSSNATSPIATNAERNQKKYPPIASKRRSINLLTAAAIRRRTIQNIHNELSNYISWHLASVDAYNKLFKRQINESVSNHWSYARISHTIEFRSHHISLSSSQCTKPTQAITKWLRCIDSATPDTTSFVSTRYRGTSE